MICPVCGYGYLDEDAMNHDICPSCGTEFGYDDVGMSHEELRKQWLRDGGKWFDRSVARPPHWDPWKQVMEAFYRPNLRAIGESKRLSDMQSPQATRLLAA